MLSQVQLLHSPKATDINLWIKLSPIKHPHCSNVYGCWVHLRFILRLTGSKILSCSHAQFLCESVGFPTAEYKMSNCMALHNFDIKLQENNAAITLKACQHCCWPTKDSINAFSEAKIISSE